MMHGFKKKLLTALAMGAALTAPAVANTLHPQPDSLAQIQAEHVMLATADYDQTLAWYQENLGFRIKHEWTVPEFPDLQLAYLEKNGFIVEVVASPNTPEIESSGDFSERLQQPGLRHFAFLVEDVDAAIATLETQGVEIVLSPTSFPDSGRRVAFIEDNNGNLIEFLEELPLGERQPYTGGEG